MSGVPHSMAGRQYGQMGRRFLKRQASRAWRREGRMLLDEARVRRRNRGWP